MMSEPRPISDYLQPGRCVHLVGIGGVSMCPLAEVLLGMGLSVQGSDLCESAATARLRALGIPVFLGHNAEHLGGCDAVIRTAAARNANPEIAGAAARGIPVYERSQAWGALMRRYPNALCISGTHGKTTATSMCTHIFMAAERDPTVMIGGTLPLLRSGHRVGQGDTVIMESCEYCNSFLNFHPTVAVILNIEADHLDFFRDIDDIQASFRAFADLVPPTGWTVANWDNANTRTALSQYRRPLLPFGITHPQAQCRAENIVWSQGLPELDIVVHGTLYAHAALKVGGTHNVSNALAAAAAAYVLGVPGEAVAQGLGSFTGASRRFEYKGTYHGAQIYDDYAHHPDELHALLTMARQRPCRRLVVAFQPHTYSRTAALFDRFVEELRLADAVILAEIYAAREENSTGISSADLARCIPGSVYCSTLDKVTSQLRALAQPGDLILTVGAGDIYRCGQQLLKPEGQTPP